MKRDEFLKNSLAATALFSFFKVAGSGDTAADNQTIPGFQPLFNGKDLSGFTDVNTSPETWKVKDGVLVCSGNPIGVMRTEKQYENFILDIEWKFIDEGGNSGCFIWADGTPYKDNPFPTGVEVQMLDPGWADITGRPIEYAHGHLFPVQGLEGTIPDNPSEVVKGRSYALENRVKPAGEWNRYIVLCIDGTIKLSVNGKFVNGMRSTQRKKGYICPEAEGAEIHFRKIDIMELPGGVLKSSQSAEQV